MRRDSTEYPSIFHSPRISPELPQPVKDNLTKGQEDIGHQARTLGDIAQQTSSKHFDWDFPVCWVVLLQYKAIPSDNETLSTVTAKQTINGLEMTVKTNFAIPLSGATLWLFGNGLDLDFVINNSAAIGIQCFPGVNVDKYPHGVTVANPAVLSRVSIPPFATHYAISPYQDGAVQMGPVDPVVTITDANLDSASYVPINPKATRVDIGGGAPDDTTVTFLIHGK